MYTNVNLAAPIGAMAFLGTGLLFFVAALIFLYTVIKGELCSYSHSIAVDCHIVLLPFALED